MSVGLPSSRFHTVATPLASFTSTFRKQCGLAQSHSVTLPLTVTSLALSKLAPPWWARRGAENTTTAMAERTRPRVMYFTSRLLICVLIARKGTRGGLYHG